MGLVLSVELLGVGPGSIAGLLGYCTVFSLLYVLVMFLMRAFTVEDIRRVLDRLSVMEKPEKGGSPAR